MKVTSKHKERVYIVLVKFDGKIFVKMMDDGEGIQGFAHRNDTINYFEDPCDRAHYASCERSTSACVHMIVFAPRVAEFRNSASIGKYLTGHTSDLSCIAGQMVGAETKGMSKLYACAKVPRLKRVEL